MNKLDNLKAYRSKLMQVDNNLLSVNMFMYENNTDIKVKDKFLMSATIVNEIIKDLDKEIEVLESDKT